jgi:hypothetical protein
MMIAERQPAVVELSPGLRAEVSTQRWTPAWSVGKPEPAALPRIWSRKPMVAVGGRPVCAELAVVSELALAGWQGVWVSAFGNFLRREWFPVPAFRAIAAAGARPWAAEIFEAVKDTNGGTLAGFFDVFAWREPGEVLFCEVKDGPGRIQASQHRFLGNALRLRPLSEFLIIEMSQPARTSLAARPPDLAGPRAGLSDQSTAYGARVLLI